MTRFIKSCNKLRVKPLSVGSYPNFLIGTVGAVLLPFAVSATQLPPPAGYTTTQLLYEDQFNTPSLDTSKWNPWIGDDTYGRWGDYGALPYPYSGVNCNSACSNSYQIMYYDPYPYGYGTNISGNHLVGGNGHLAEIADLNAHFSNLGYSWASSAVTSYGHMYLPATGGYVQWHAKMPDSRYGAWASLWLLSTGGAEMDIQESGYPTGSAPVNNVLASHWQGSGGSENHQDTGMDLSAAYHTYGIEYKPGQSWKVYLDGKLMATWTSGVPTSAYQVLMDLEIAGPNTNGWHTVASSANPGPFEFDIDDVQIYSLSSSPPPDTTPPSVPTGLSATFVNSGEIDLAWSASTDDVAVTGYNILRNGTAIGTSTTPAYADKTVSPGGSYTYTVDAYDAAGNVSGHSQGVAVTIPNFAQGSAVYTLGSTNVMSRAGRGTAVCTQPANTNGTILSGPTSQSHGGTWWYVGFVSACFGWVPQTSLGIN